MGSGDLAAAQPRTIKKSAQKSAAVCVCCDDCSARGAAMTDAERDALCAAIDQSHDDQVRFLAELVKVASDNPPGDCAPHAARAAELLAARGLAAERHVVPADLVRA